MDLFVKQRPYGTKYVGVKRHENGEIDLYHFDKAIYDEKSKQLLLFITLNEWINQTIAVMRNIDAIIGPAASEIEIETDTEEIEVDTEESE